MMVGGSWTVPLPRPHHTTDSVQDGGTNADPANQEGMLPVLHFTYIPASNDANYHARLISQSPFRLRTRALAVLFGPELSPPCARSTQRLI